MYKLLYFLQKTGVVILFILIEIIAINRYMHSTPYTQARAVAISHSISGWSSGIYNDVGNYFYLRKENRALAQKVALLQNQVDMMRVFIPDSMQVIPTDMPHNLNYMSAKISASSTAKPQNFITINKGYNDGVVENMAILSPEGYAVGNVVRCSEHFAVAKSLLNTDFTIGARLLRDGAVGTIHWSGGDSSIIDFNDVSKYADIEIGDLVVASGYSHFFPTDVIIGKIAEIGSSELTSAITCKVKLSADFSRLENVILVNNSSIDEAIALEKEN